VGAIEPTVSSSTVEAVTGTDHITATSLHSHSHLPQIGKFRDGLINNVRHIAHLRQECHDSKFGIFELLV
jgi:hypothetical protein